MTRPTKENRVKYSEFREFHNEFIQEMQAPSERGFVILGVAYLDEALKQLLAAFLLEDVGRKEEFLDGEGNGPLGTLHSRIRATYLLGLISEEEYEDLERLREIRNQYAHALHGVTLDNDYIRQKVDALGVWRQLYDVRPAPSVTVATYLLDDISSREVIQLTIVFLAKAMELRIKHAKAEQRVPAKRIYIIAADEQP